MVRKKRFLVKRRGQGWRRLSAKEFPKAVRATYLRDRRVLWGKRRRVWIEPPPSRPPPPPPTGPVRVTVGTGVSVEGQSFSLTYQEWVEDDQDEIDKAVARGEDWIRDVIVSNTGNPKYRTDKSWAALDWGSTDGFNVGVDNTIGVLGRVIREGTRQAFIREGKKWKRSGKLIQLAFGRGGELV